MNLNDGRKYTEADERYLRLHYASMDTAELAAHLNRGRKAVVAYANKLGLHKDKVLSSMDRNIIAVKDRPEGFVCSDLPGDAHDNSSAINRMVQSGALFKVKEFSRVVRYFGSLPAADAWRTRTDRAPAVTIRHDRSHAWWNTRAQPGDVDFIEPMITAQTVVTVGKSPQLGLRTSTHLE